MRHPHAIHPRVQPIANEPADSRAPARPAWPSFAAWTAGGRRQVAAIERRTASGAAATELMVVRLTEAFPDPPTPDVSLQLVTRHPSGDPLDADFGRGRFRVASAGSLLVSPHDTPNDHRGGGPVELLTASFPFAWLAATVARTGLSPPQDLGPLHARATRDERLASLMHRLWAAAADGSPLGGLDCDGLAASLAARLLRLADAPTPAAPRRASLGAKSLACVVALMQDHVDEGLAGPSLLEAADRAGYSEFHFARLFKAATGKTPGAYVMRLRVERADRLIRASRRDEAVTLAGVALDCGFSDQSHMTRSYRRAFGVTPAAARDAR